MFLANEFVVFACVRNEKDADLIRDHKNPNLLSLLMDVTKDDQVVAAA